jgi:hypothetical protein
MWYYKQGIMKKYFLIIIFSLACLSSCSLGTDLLMLLFNKAYNKKEEKHEEKLTFEEASRQVDLWWAINVEDVDKVKQYLEEGYDPNKSRGEQGYRDSNPLNIIVEDFFDTYARVSSREKIPDPPPDVEMIRLLIEAGADVNRRPYIWRRVYTWNNFFLDYRAERKNLRRKGQPPETKEEIEEYNNEKIIEPIYFVNDTNRVIEAFLKAGADPDKRGHPYPYTNEAYHARITDEEADEYFAKGTRPINEAIKKGIRWESQVDLLLKYTTLDEDSLKAAKESKDPAMIEKITKLWKEQNAGKK